MREIDEKISDYRRLSKIIDDRKLDDNEDLFGQLPTDKMLKEQAEQRIIK